MYAGKVATVPVPQVEGKDAIRILTNGYVYYATNRRWDSVQKRTLEDRVPIGRLDEKNSKMMYPNKNYEKIFGTIDPEVDNLKKIYDRENLREAGRFDFEMSYGPYVALKECAKKCGLLDALQRAMPLIAQRVLAVAIHPIVNRLSTAQNFDDWIFDNYCGFDIPLSDSDVSKLFKVIGNDAGSREIFFELYRKNFHEIFPNTNSEERVCAFDSTNQKSTSKTIAKAQFGKSKNDKIERIINTAVYTDELTSISIWYENYDGNILDKSQTPYSIEKAKQLGYKKLFLMMDRGYFSFKNTQIFNGQNIGFGMMMPETVSAVKEMIWAYKDKIKLQEQYYIHEEDIYGIQTTIELIGEKLQTCEFYCYVYYDNNTYYEELKSIHEKTIYYLQKAKSRKRYSKKFAEHFKKFGIIIDNTSKNDETNQNFIITTDHEMIQEACDQAGFFIIISNRMMSAKNMIHIARSRDSVEKGFMFLKSHFNLATTGDHNDVVYDGKMFVAFISLILLQSFRWFTKDLLTSKTSETTSTLIAELRKYKIRQTKENDWMPVYAMNKKQKDIFKCISLTEGKVVNDIRSLRVKK